MCAVHTGEQLICCERYSLCDANSMTRSAPTTSSRNPRTVPGDSPAAHLDLLALTLTLILTLVFVRSCSALHT